MARLSLLLLGLPWACQAWQYEGPNGIPSTDRCGADCENICKQGLGRTSFNAWMSCKKACTAHAVQTTSSRGEQQGKYIQKVMGEYCTRGVCAAAGGLVTEGVEVKRHDSSAPPWGSWPFPPMPGAAPSGSAPWWSPKTTTPKPTGCTTKEFYCNGLCKNMYHTVQTDLGPHPGTENPKVDEPQCERDCQANWETMAGIWDKYCACIKQNGAPFLPAKLVQTTVTEEEVDVGSFVQDRVELQQLERDL